jgi:nitroreductase
VQPLRVSNVYLTPIAEARLLATLNWRHATKNFDPARKIPAATWAALGQTLVLAPSSFGLQPSKFVVVDDPAVRQTLVPASWVQAAGRGRASRRVHRPQGLGRGAR